MPMVRVSNGGTMAEARIIVTSNEALGTALAINKGIISRTMFWAAYPSQFPITWDNAVKFTMNQASPYTTTLTFLKAGYYCVANTWKYKNVNSTDSIALSSFVSWYSDLKQH